ncbi:MAG: GNAT family N-acetyltransferase [Gemmatimonadaceae bacterium]
MHNQSATSLAFAAPDLTDGNLLPVRAAVRGDVGQIADLVLGYVAEGLMLPRNASGIAINIDNYVVATDGDRVVACAALEEYSPSLAEVASVAVAKSHHGAGLGTQVVLGVERLARARNIAELFALSLTGQFFLSLDYTATDISKYPEKLARYDSLIAAGVQIVPKPCFQKMLGTGWQLPRLVTASSLPIARRAS